MDSFTEDIFGRLQARQEKLDMMQGKVTSSKRGRQPLTEKCENNEDESVCEKEDSPKRICRDETIGRKENVLPAPTTPLRGLAALRQHNFNDDCQPSISSVRMQEMQETVNKSETTCPRRLNTKLSALASQISQWDSRSQNSSPATNSSHQSSKTKGLNSAAINKVDPPVSDVKDVGNAAGDGSVASVPTPPPLPPPGSPAKSFSIKKMVESAASPPVASLIQLKSPSKPPRAQQTPAKKAVWDEAIVATLESQGFTKTPSKSKLEYDYKKSSVRKRVEDYELATGAGSVEEKADPAELPVSAKRAMFEQKPELLGIVQKAALFNKGGIPKTPVPLPMSRTKTSTGGQGFQNKNQSTVTLGRTSSGSGTRNAEKRSCTLARTPSGSRKDSDFCGVPLCRENIAASTNPAAFSPKKVGSSPVKSLGEHTRKMQEILFSQPQVSNCSEIAMRQKMERQKEMEALSNRWNRDTSTPQQHLEPTAENTQHFQSPDEEPSASEDFEDSANEKSYTHEASSICRRLDEMLDDALDEDVSVLESTGLQSENSYDPEETIDPEITQSSSPSLSVGFPEPSSPVENLEVKTAYRFLTPNNLKDDVGNVERSEQNEEAVELIHTISFYRRQKQECATPPVRCIVRRKEEVVSPPSPKFQSVDLAAHLKSLQEELYKQDVSLRQASQVVALCSSTPEFHSSPQHVEGEKLLLISTLRRHALKQEIERLKTEAVLGSRAGENIGILTITDLRLPLKREFLATQLEHPRLSEEAVHHFICILKYREKVVSTELLSTSDDITAGTFCFSNHICLQDLGGNFSVSFEVYALQTSKYNQEKKGHPKKDHNKVKLTPKIKRTEAKSVLSPSHSVPISSDAVRTSNFGLVGYTRFHLENCRHKCFHLEKVPAVSPLEGRLDVKLQLHANVSIEERGFLTIFEDISGFGAWHRRWFVLSHSRLSFWKYPDEETKKDPMGSISLKQCVSPEVTLVPRDVCARPNTFQLLCVRPQSKNDQNTLVTQSHNSFTMIKYLLSADTKEERIIWCRRLTEALTTLRLWNTDALRPIEGAH